MTTLTPVSMEHESTMGERVTSTESAPSSSSSSSMSSVTFIDDVTSNDAPTRDESSMSFDTSTAKMPYLTTDNEALITVTPSILLSDNLTEVTSSNIALTAQTEQPVNCTSSHITSAIGSRSVSGTRAVDQGVSSTSVENTDLTSRTAATSTESAQSSLAPSSSLSVSPIDDVIIRVSPTEVTPSELSGNSTGILQGRFTWTSENSNITVSHATAVSSSSIGLYTSISVTCFMILALIIAVFIFIYCFRKLKRKISDLEAAGESNPAASLSPSEDYDSLYAEPESELNSLYDFNYAGMPLNLSLIVNVPHPPTINPALLRSVRAGIPLPPIISLRPPCTHPSILRSVHSRPPLPPPRRSTILAGEQVNSDVNALVKLNEQLISLKRPLEMYIADGVDSDEEIYDDPLPDLVRRTSTKLSSFLSLLGTSRPPYPGPAELSGSVVPLRIMTWVNLRAKLKLTMTELRIRLDKLMSNEFCTVTSAEDVCRNEAAHTRRRTLITTIMENSANVCAQLEVYTAFLIGDDSMKAIMTDIEKSDFTQCHRSGEESDGPIEMEDLSGEQTDEGNRSRQELFDLDCESVFGDNWDALDDVNPLFRDLFDQLKTNLAGLRRLKKIVASQSSTDNKLSDVSTVFHPDAATALVLDSVAVLNHTTDLDLIQVPNSSSDIITPTVTNTNSVSDSDQRDNAVNDIANSPNAALDTTMCSDSRTEETPVTTTECSIHALQSSRVNSTAEPVLEPGSDTSNNSHQDIEPDVEVIQSPIYSSTQLAFIQVSEEAVVEPTPVPLADLVADLTPPPEAASSVSLEVSSISTVYGSVPSESIVTPQPTPDESSDDELRWKNNLLKTMNLTGRLVRDLFSDVTEVSEDVESEDRMVYYGPSSDDFEPALAAESKILWRRVIPTRPAIEGFLADIRTPGAQAIRSLLDELLSTVSRIVRASPPVSCDTLFNRSPDRCDVTAVNDNDDNEYYEVPSLLNNNTTRHDVTRAHDANRIFNVMRAPGITRQRNVIRTSDAVDRAAPGTGDADYNNAPFSSNNETEYYFHASARLVPEDGDVYDSTNIINQPGYIPVLPADESQDIYRLDEVDYFSPEIDRSSETWLDDLFRLYLNTPETTLRRQLCVTFRGEAGLDGGALTRDYFYIVFNALTSDRLMSRSLFEGERGHLLPCVDHQLLESRAFWFLGVLIAQASNSRCQGPPGLADAMRHFLHAGAKMSCVADSLAFVTLEDFVDTDIKSVLQKASNSRCQGPPGLADAMRHFLHAGAKMSCVADSLAFVTLEDFVDTDIKSVLQKLQTEDQDLDENERSCLDQWLIDSKFTRVYNESTRTAAVQRILNYFIFDSRMSQLQAIAEGMSLFGLKNTDQVDVNILFPVDHKLTLSEFMLGLHFDLTEDEDPYSSILARKHFETYCEDIANGLIDNIKLELLLQFFTGAPYFPSMRQAVVTFAAPDVNQSMPVAHACGLQLVLPTIHNDYNDFRDMMTKALEYSGVGFGIA